MKRFVAGATVILSMTVSVLLSAGYTYIRTPHAASDAGETPREQVFRARLLFAGDVMAHLPQVTAARRADGDYDFDGQFRLVRPIFEAADLVAVNLETTLSTREPYTGYPCFRSPAALARALRRAGVDVAVTANNHCCDHGTAGIGATLAALDDTGIRHTGTFVDTLRHGGDHPLRIEINGIRFALLNYTYGTNGLPVPAGVTVNRIDTTAIARALRAIDRRQTDCIVALMHWGNEYQRRPDAAQRALAAWLRRQGVDLVIGSHPHVIQPYEADSTGAVFYSLGNFVSNQRRRYCDGGLLAEVEVVKRIGNTPARSVTMRYAARAIPVWVSLPGYRILPPQSIDTLDLPASARFAAERFLNDTRQLLGIAD